MSETTHGRVRAHADSGLRGNETEIGVTFWDREHVISINDALGLANAIIMTCVDGKQRNMRDKMNEHLDARL